MIVIIGFILVIIVCFLLYSNHNYRNGVQLDVRDTIKNIFGLLDPIEIPTNEVPEIEKPIQKKKEKEVFNIDNNNFTYEQAGLVCDAYNSELATYPQLLEAHRKGANWCNYGWSANKMALYPTQAEHYNKLQLGPDNKKKSCGKPGVNGGIFKDTALKFGVNCYGYKPRADPSKIIYEDDENYNIKKNLTSDEGLEKMNFLYKYKDMIKNGELEVRPFNNDKWSKYSQKKSSYMLTPKESLELVMEKDVDDSEKDPRNINGDVI